MTTIRGLPQIVGAIAPQARRIELGIRLSRVYCIELARAQLNAYRLMVIVLVLSLPSAWAKAVQPVKLVEGTALFDAMKTCALTWRYDKQSDLLILPEPTQMSIRTPAKIRDGYAEVRIRSDFYGLRVLSVTVPTERDVWQQFAIHVSARPDEVRSELERVWNTKFDETGIDGLDGKVAISFRISGPIGNVRILGRSKSSRMTVIECNPAFAGTRKE